MSSHGIGESQPVLEKAWRDNEHPSSVHGCEYIVLTRYKLGSRQVEPSYQVDCMLKILPAVALWQ